MEPYTFYDHTADAEFKARGKTLEESFGNSAKALVSCMFDLKDLSSDNERSIEITGTDQKSLLYNFLEEILFLIDTESFITIDIKEMTISGNSLTAVLLGSPLEPDLDTHGEVKAITYNSMEIGKEKDIYFVRVVVDM